MVAKMKDFLKLSGDNVTATNVIYAIYRYDDVDKLLNLSYRKIEFNCKIFELISNYKKE